MEAFGLAIVIAAIVWFVRRQDTQTKLLAAHANAGHTRHLRSGEYPASCSWCRGTSLARKLLVFERTPEGWESTDLAQRLRDCADPDVARLANVFQSDTPAFRRFCAESCVHQFFAAERAPLRERFVACTYCSTRAPASLVRCPNCGGGRA